MTIDEAIVECKRNGSWVASEHFDFDQSMHYFNGKLYFEDGAVVSIDILHSIPTYRNADWHVKYTDDQIDHKMLEELHEKYKGFTLFGCSYEDCLIR